MRAGVVGNELQNFFLARGSRLEARCLEFDKYNSKQLAINYLCRMHYISAEGLTKSYGIKPLFSNISFHIEEGDKIALVARNGTGKSTLLRILAGKEVPDEGKLWINKDVDTVLFEQEPVFMEDRTVLDNIFFP